MTHRSLLHKLPHRRGKVSVRDFANKSQQHLEVENLNSKKVISEWHYFPQSTGSCSAGGGQTEADCSATTSVSVTANEEDYLTGHAADAPAHSHIFTSLASFKTHIFCVRNYLCVFPLVWKNSNSGLVAEVAFSLSRRTICISLTCAKHK